MFLSKKLPSTLEEKQNALLLLDAQIRECIDFVNQIDDSHLALFPGRPPGYKEIVTWNNITSKILRDVWGSGSIFYQKFNSHSFWRDNDFRVTLDKKAGLLRVAIKQIESEIAELKSQLPHGAKPMTESHQSNESLNKGILRVFIAHGRSQDWREVQAYLEKSVGIETVELAQQTSEGKTILQKLDTESRKCTYAVIIMTGDDDVGGNEIRARENVIHEIGFFQGRYGLDRVFILHEERVNIPSNIHGLVYESFPKGNVRAALAKLRDEIDAAIKKS